MLPAESPRLPKWPFLAGDAVLLGTAALIVSRAEDPYAGGPLVAIVLCTLGGAALAAIPFLAEYARRQDEALDERQRALEGLSRTIVASAEQISIAAGGLNEIASIAQRNLQASAAPQTASNGEADAAIADLREELARVRAADAAGLKAVAEKAARAAADIAKFEATAQKNLTTATDILARTTAAIETLNAKAAARSLAASMGSNPPIPSPTAAVPAEPPAAAPAPAAPAVPESPILEVTTTQVDTNAPVPVEAAPASPSGPPRKPRRQRTEKPAEAAKADSAHPVAVLSASPMEAPPVEKTEDVLVELPERARSSDGATRVLVTAYIGIGNRLFIRGEGPGLSWDKGVPLQFVSIGRWRWEAADPAPVKFKLFKNDDAECTALGCQTLGAGEQGELTATF